MSYFKHAFSMAILALMAGTALANVYFRGKPVHGGTTANCPVDVMRLMWGNDDMNTGDRIQGQIQVSKIVEEVNSIKIIIQGIDSAGEIVESYALSLARHEHSGSSRYPFRGVVFLRYERGYIDRELENAWFYFDFPKKPEIKNFLVVNMVLNEREVPCNLRLVNNKLPRTLATLPKMKLGGQGDFSATTEWLPPPTPTAESELVKKPNKTKTTRSEGGEAKPMLDAKVDEIAGEIKCRFSVGSSSMPEARNYDFAFSRAQVAALRELAQKCLEE